MRVLLNCGTGGVLLEEDMGNKKFSERVKLEREKKHLTQEALAQKLGIQKTRVCMWETNGVVPRQDVLLKLCKFFGVGTDYLLGNDEITDNPATIKINSIQRMLVDLNPAELETAEAILKAAFKKSRNR